jgi:hypothetical protein
MSTPRWKCSDCGSTNVQVSLPTWYTETLDKIEPLEMVETDSDAEVMYWWCVDCENTEPAIDMNDYDPTPYCLHCGPKTNCDCGPIAEND